MPAQRGINKYTDKDTVGIQVPQRTKTHRPRCHECEREIPSDDPRTCTEEGWEIRMEQSNPWYWLCPDHAGGN